MDFIVNLGRMVGAVLHWLTGWLVHPNDGGCCKTDQVKTVAKENLENLKK